MLCVQMFSLNSTGFPVGGGGGVWRGAEKVSKFNKHIFGCTKVF